MAFIAYLKSRICVFPKDNLKEKAGAEGTSIFQKKMEQDEVGHCPTFRPVCSANEV